MRYEKTIDGQTINHVWDGSKQIIADVIDNQFYEADCYIRGTNLVAKYNYRNGDKSEYTYYTQNAHGDVVNLTDKDGKVTKSYKYDAFGVEINLDTNDVNVFRFCGEYYDTETGTVYLRARYYQASIGRFISRDSFAGKNEDPLSLNLYTYCHNNPIYYIDPSGHGIKSILNKLTQKIETAVGEILFPKPKSDSVIHSTPLNPQEESNWCWNACSQMFAATYGYTNHNQTEAAENLFPEEEDRNLPANMLQVKSTIEFYSDNNLKTVRSGVLSETRLAKILEVRGPVIIMRGVYNEEGKKWRT